MKTNAPVTSVRLPDSLRKEIKKSYPKVARGTVIRLAVEYAVKNKLRLVEGVGVRFEDENRKGEESENRKFN